MNHPPYHLRPNKAIDRFLLADVIRRLASGRAGTPGIELRKYRYYGFGGPFLDDFRLFGQLFEGLKMVSLEKRLQVYRRQRFHRVGSRVTLLNVDLRTFVTQEAGGHPCIFWLDFTDRSFPRFDEFAQVLSWVGDGSIVKVTIRAEPDRDVVVRFAEEGAAAVEERREKALARFREEYDELVPAAATSEMLNGERLPSLLQEMVRIRAQRALKSPDVRTFQILQACTYADDAQMLSVTGFVGPKAMTSRCAPLVRGAGHANTNWAPPGRIEVPSLSLKERMKIEHLLPRKKGTGKRLLRALGYTFDDGEPSAIGKLDQYVEFHRFYPMFAKVQV